jgi:hypothetical protein
MSTSPKPQPRPSNAPPREQWPKPKPRDQWSPDEYLQALEEDQDEKRNNTNH